MLRAALRRLRRGTHPWRNVKGATPEKYSRFANTAAAAGVRSQSNAAVASKLGTILRCSASNIAGDGETLMRFVSPGRAALLLATAAGAAVFAQTVSSLPLIYRQPPPNHKISDIGQEALKTGQSQNDASAEYATIKHDNGSATLSVFSYGRPLLSGLIAFREEYGTKIYLEQRPCDQAPGGQKFETNYPENPSLRNAPSAINEPRERSYFLPDSSVESILNKIVSDYNKSGPVCRYSLITQSDGSYVVSMSALRSGDGTYEPVIPLLDTPISIPAGVEFFDAIGKALSAASGLHVVLDMQTDVGILLPRSRATSGPARALIHEALPDTLWDLYCESRGQLCVVNLESRRRAEYDNLGHRRTLP